MLSNVYQFTLTDINYVCYGFPMTIEFEAWTLPTDEEYFQFMMEEQAMEAEQDALYAGTWEGFDSPSPW